MKNAIMFFITMVFSSCQNDRPNSVEEKPLNNTTIDTSTARELKLLCCQPGVKGIDLRMPENNKVLFFTLDKREMDNYVARISGKFTPMFPAYVSNISIWIKLANVDGWYFQQKELNNRGLLYFTNDSIWNANIELINEPKEGDIIQLAVGLTKYKDFRQLKKETQSDKTYTHPICEVMYINDNIKITLKKPLNYYLFTNGLPEFEENFTYPVKDKLGKTIKTVQPYNVTIKSLNSSGLIVIRESRGNQEENITYFDLLNGTIVEDFSMGTKKFTYKKNSKDYEKTLIKISKKLDDYNNHYYEYAIGQEQIKYTGIAQLSRAIKSLKKNNTQSK